MYIRDIVDNIVQLEFETWVLRYVYKGDFC